MHNVGIFQGYRCSEIGAFVCCRIRIVHSCATLWSTLSGPLKATNLNSIWAQWWPRIRRRRTPGATKLKYFPSDDDVKWRDVGNVQKIVGFIRQSGNCLISLFTCVMTLFAFCQYSCKQTVIPSHRKIIVWIIHFLWYLHHSQYNIKNISWKYFIKKNLNFLHILHFLFIMKRVEHRNNL